MSSPKVSVIIPVYNVEPYIERCSNALFSQTLDDMEFIFVDDCSPDNSAAIIHSVLERYPSRKGRVSVLSHDRNMGLAAARTTGIRAASGDYIIHCDSDDWPAADMYERMYERAVETGADVVLCNYWLNGKEVRHRYGRTPQQCLKNIYRKHSHYLHQWSKLVRRSLVEEHDIVPYEGIEFGEDFNCTVRVLYWAKSISVIEEPLYHYCVRENSLSTSASVVHDFGARRKQVAKVCEFFEQQNDRRYDTLCNYLKFQLKFEFRSSFADDREWFEFYRECHRDILKFDENSLKNRLVLYSALRNYTMYRFMKKFVGGL